MLTWDETVNGGIDAGSTPIDAQYVDLTVYNKITGHLNAASGDRNDFYKFRYTGILHIDILFQNITGHGGFHIVDTYYAAVTDILSTDFGYAYDDTSIFVDTGQDALGNNSLLMSFDTASLSADTDYYLEMFQDLGGSADYTVTFAISLPSNFWSKFVYSEETDS